MWFLGFGFLVLGVIAGWGLTPCVLKFEFPFFGFLVALVISRRVGCSTDSPIYLLSLL